MAEEMLARLQPMPCKCCGSKYTRRYGHSKEKKQRWLCNSCHHTFIENGAAPGMKTPPDKIGAALSLFFEGQSLASVTRSLKQIYGRDYDPSTVYSWVTRYSKEAITKAKELKPNVGDVWLVDETVLKIGGSKVWLYDLIDSKTRFLLASHLAKSRYLGDARMVLRKAEIAAGKKPKVVISDGLPSYPQAIGDVFGANVRHIKYKGLTSQPNNNILERFHGSLKSRTKVMRGMKTIPTARLIVEAWLVFYNFMRPHESLNEQTPAKRCGINYPFDNWSGIVKAEKPKVETVTWADKPPKFVSNPIPPNVRRALGMGRMPKGLR